MTFVCDFPKVQLFRFAAENETIDFLQKLDENSLNLN